MRLLCPLIIFLLFIPHYPIFLKKTLLDLIERAFKKVFKTQGILHVTIRNRFSLLQTIEGINFGLVRIYVTPHRIYIRIGNKLFRQIVGIPMGTNCTIVADLFLFCYEKDFMTTLSDDNQADIIEVFNSTSQSNAVVLLWFSVACFWCQSFGEISPCACSYYF